MPIPYRNLQDEHQRLLEWRESARDSQEFLNAVRDYIQRTRQDAQWITASRSRNQLRANLRFWASYLYDHTGAYPDTSLLPPRDMETGGAYTGGSYSPQAEMEAESVQGAAYPEAESPSPQMSPEAMGANLRPLIQAQPVESAQPQTYNRLSVLIGGGALLVVFALIVVWVISNLPNGGTQYFPQEDTPVAFLPTAMDVPIFESTPTSVETTLPEFDPTAEPLPTLEPLVTVTPLIEATSAPTMQPFPTSTSAVILPETGGGDGAESDDVAANTFLGRAENGGLSSCRSRSVTLRFVRPAIFEGISLDPALVRLSESQTGNVVAEARWVMGQPLTIDLPAASTQTTLLLQITHPQLMFSTHILSFAADCTQNAVQLAFDTLKWQPQMLNLGSSGEIQTPEPLEWTLLNWGPAPDGLAWVALLQVNAGENAFYWVSGDTLSAQDEPSMDGRLMVAAAICEPARVWVDVTLAGDTLRYPLILQAPVCR